MTSETNTGITPAGNRHDRLESTLDAMATDRDMKAAQVIAALGNGFAAGWAAEYAEPLLHDYVSRGLANRRRRISKRSRLADSLGKKPTNRIGSAKPIKVVLRTQKSEPVVAAVRLVRRDEGGTP